MSDSETIATTAVTAVFFTAFVGWIANIAQIVMLMDAPLTGVFVVKCLGVLLAPLGAIMGIIGMF